MSVLVDSHQYGKPLGTGEGRRVSEGENGILLGRDLDGFGAGVRTGGNRLGLGWFNGGSGIWLITLGEWVPGMDFEGDPSWLSN